MTAPFPSHSTPLATRHYPVTAPTPSGFARPLLRLRSPRMLVVGEPDALRSVIERVAHQVDGDAVIDWAPNASEARRMLRAIAYDAVVSDPGNSRDTSGRVLHAWCRRLQPKARFGVLSSVPVRDLVAADPGYPALPRPFSAGQLRGFLETLLTD